MQRRFWYNNKKVKICRRAIAKGFTATYIKQKNVVEIHSEGSIVAVIKANDGKYHKIFNSLWRQAF